MVPLRKHKPHIEKRPASSLDACAWATCNGLPDPYPVFLKNRQTAKSRGVEWKLTFDQWWELWKPHYAERGRPESGPGMSLCRTLDNGAYEVGNVRVATWSENSSEQNMVRKMKEAGTYPFPA
jgi:hypothetical protein